MLLPTGENPRYASWRQQRYQIETKVVAGAITPPTRAKQLRVEANWLRLTQLLEDSRQPPSEFLIAGSDVKLAFRGTKPFLYTEHQEVREVLEHIVYSRYHQTARWVLREVTIVTPFYGSDL